jgi:tetratricopeptide (TPR) repeat protein
VIGIIQVGQQAYADRYTYVPLVGIFIIVAWGIPDALARLSARSRQIALSGAAAAVLVCLSVCTWIQIGYWHDTTRLTQHAFKVTHGHNFIRVIAAKSLEQQGHDDKAIQLLKQGQPNTPGMARVHNALGRMLAEEHRMREAETRLREAIRLEPDLALAHRNLGVVLQFQGRVSEAMDEFRKAAKFDPQYAEPHFDMANLLAAQGNADQALVEYEETSRLNPERTDARYEAAVILLKQGYLNKASSKATEALEVDPNYGKAHYVLGCIYRQQGSLDAAIEHLQRAAELEKKWALPHCSLAMALFARNDYASAWQEVELAHRFGGQLDPRFIADLSRQMPQPGHRSALNTSLP